MARPTGFNSFESNKPFLNFEVTSALLSQCVWVQSFISYKMPVSCILKLELLSPLQFFTHGFPLKKRQTQTLFNFNMAFLVVDIDQSGALLSIPNLIIIIISYFFWQDLNSEFSQLPFERSMHLSTYFSFTTSQSFLQHTKNCHNWIHIYQGI